LILYKIDIIKHSDHSTIKSIEHVDNSYYYDNIKLFESDCMFGGPHFPGGLTNKGWAYNSINSYYLIDITTYNMNISAGSSCDNPQTIHDEFVCRLWEIRDNKINSIIEI